MLPVEFIVFAFYVAVYTLFSIMGGPAPAQISAGVAQTTAVVNAANNFLDLLTPDYRAEIMYPYEAQEVARPVYFEKSGGGGPANFRFVGEQYGQSVWSNFPVSDVPRPGLRLGNLTYAQHEAAMGLLSVMLSDRGYSKVQDIMGSDQVLADSGEPYAAGRAVYTLAIFGEPSLSGLWMVQFGGHHLALNIAMYKGRGVLAPVLTGALPANYTENNIAKRTLAHENDKAFLLLATLDADQRKQAIIDHSVTDVVLGPGEDGEFVAAVGVKASLFTTKQRAMLLDLISEWAGMINTVHAGPRLAEIRAGLDDTFFAWSGPEAHEPGRNGAAYFRIQGPNLFIEFSPQFPGGDLTMHVHTIYRDPLRAYGRTLIEGFGTVPDTSDL